MRVTQPPNAHQALEGLAGFSHVWLLFEFHLNTNTKVRPKVHAPRLLGGTVGLYASRAPHRPLPIGLSCARLEAVQHDTLLLSCVDLVHGTPILDIKPYIPYDCVPEATVPSWVGQRLEHYRRHDDATDTDTDTGREELPLRVKFTEQLHHDLERCLPVLRFFQSVEHTKAAIAEVLAQDIRSPAMRSKSAVGEFGFCIDNLNVRFSVDDASRTCTVLGADPWRNYLD